jgi:hypothetical protein
VAKKKVERLKDQLHKLELQATDKEENKEIALGTSKLNYLDPRISVSWCVVTHTRAHIHALSHTHTVHAYLPACTLTYDSRQHLHTCTHVYVQV